MFSNDPVLASPGAAGVSGQPPDGVVDTLRRRVAEALIPLKEFRSGNELHTWGF